MTTFATNCATPASAAATAMTTAVANLNTLRANFAANFPGTTLGNLGGTNAAALRNGMGELRLRLDTAAADLAVAAQEVQSIGAAIASLAALD